MRRYLSLSKSSKGGESHEVPHANKSFLDDDTSILGSTAPTVVPELPIPNLKVKKVDHFYSRWSRKWKFADTGSNITPELRPFLTEGKDDPWQQYCFVVVREIPQYDSETETGPGKPYFSVMIKSPYLLKACKEVIGDIHGFSWNVLPLQLDPQLLLAFLPNFQRYRDNLRIKGPTCEEKYLRSTVDVLIDYLRKDYRSTIANMESLTSHGEITYDILFAILVPRSIVVSVCPVTGELQAFRLVSVTRNPSEPNSPYTLSCENTDLTSFGQGQFETFGKIHRRIRIPHFHGTMKITSLNAYPIQYHPHEDEVTRSLIARGRKWASLRGKGAHHMQYEGSAVRRSNDNTIMKWTVNSRVMIDGANFRKCNPEYPFSQSFAVPPPPPPGGFDAPQIIRHASRGRSRSRSRSRSPVRNNWLYRRASTRVWATDDVPYQYHTALGQELNELSDDELLLTSPILYGFSLTDKLWFEFNVEHFKPIEWDETAFSNLVLPSDRKTLLQSLVEAHNAELGFDDFIKGKGRGLVVNLFGPPGVGKTLSAEATSEHVKRPLYVVGAGDLGTKASDLDKNLQRVFELATAWKAIVLIDEADVFLEKRSLRDLERNAMVAVFLRHLEYYPAILFLTTNRVETFDPAFLSRIHIALHFQGLSTAAKAQIWTAFLRKTGVKIGMDSGVTEEDLMRLAERNLNGRQVKNATKTAQSLAMSRNEALDYKHLCEVLDVMEQFTADFERMKVERD